MGLDVAQSRSRWRARRGDGGPGSSAGATRSPDLTVNQKVFVVYQEGRYRTFVLDVDPPRYVLAYPFPDEVCPEVGEQVQLEWLRGGQWGTLAATVDGRSERPVSSLTVRPCGEASYTYRREAFRLEVSRPCEVRLADGSEFPGTTVDISATGARVRLPCEAAVELGTTVVCTIRLREAPTWSCPAEVVRSQPLAEGQELALRFLDPQPTEQDRLVRWLFALQRDLRRKGLA
jgi:c-di-GMP-binding flagellar brake protein YcgR